ncbi:acyl-CoA synthetase (AMP-forming)/AMP-acid ligase II [Aequorivita sublithincola DSM 14238]|uniref:Acyl-CoA synthetase (AMP-forming)/AMP-acid ligase II n=1 Tax=Aequorivita sublithincola (strain DSM 14238 / LMG 21431 / ACAM 643 / 9-3) TaxID=746697 RepID=I3YXU6_AEQSU|nr:AMP-binding protein [Aequorivita sublithincola]AFL81814.1 acyl-CoA synthetase (AMP-forming)/AMP-acid ligase II [Aequorivita sublithincola DSM 14238]
MKQLLHPNFKLNSEAFSSSEALKKHAKFLCEKGKNDETTIGKFISEWLDENDFITVKTSGSTGVPKEIKLQKNHVFNSAEATTTYFDLKEETKALLCLPSEYIAGKMMLVRAMTGGWDLHTGAPDKNPLENANDDFDFTAMVPYQVFHSLSDLHNVKKLIVGGGAIPWKLEEQLQKIKTQVFATYGMTETISHIAVRPVNGVGKSVVFSALPKVNFSQTENGCLQIHASEISEEMVVTNDVVELISSTSFKFLGRIDNVINTGGVKVHPETVEEKLSQHINQQFFIASEKDDALGEQVILIVETDENISLENFYEAFQNISNFEKPRKIYTLSKFHYTETGKIKRAEVLKTLFGN